jgi:outer membrane protein assembly factor BamB
VSSPRRPWSQDSDVMLGPSEWTAFRGSPTHPGSSVPAHPIEEPGQIWEFDTGGTVESSPTVVDGRLYCGSFANHLFALDALTGEELWRFPVEGLVRASPSVAQGLVYFGADDNHFYALDALDGAVRWKYKLGGGGEQSSPTILDGICYFGAFDHSVYALDAGSWGSSGRRGKGEGEEGPDPGSEAVRRGERSGESPASRE